MSRVRDVAGLGRGGELEPCQPQRPLGMGRVGPDHVAAERHQPLDRLRRGGICPARRGRTLHLLLEPIRSVGDSHDLSLAHRERRGEGFAIQAQPA